MSQRSSLAASIGESRERANVFESRNDDIVLLWRVRQSTRDKTNIRFLSELKAKDDVLIADPYALVRRPVLDAPPALPANVSGLDVAIKAMERLGGDRALSNGETLDFLFGVAGRVEIPKQTAPEQPQSTPAASSGATP